MTGQPHAILRATSAHAERPARGNLIPLRRTEGADSSGQAPLLRVAEGDRPAPLGTFAAARFRFAPILLVSLLVHAALSAFFRTEPKMMASAGEDAVTVEVIVGADSAAGTA